MNPEELERFLAEPGAHLVLDPDLTIVNVGPEFLRVTASVRESILDRDFFDAFPSPDKEAQRSLRKSFQRVIATRETDKLPPSRYDLKRADGSWEIRWWRITNIPILGKGELQYIVQRFEDITQECVNAEQIRGIRRSNYILYIFTILAMAFSIWGLTQEIKNTNKITKQNQAVLNTGRQQRFQELSDVCTQVNRLDGKIRSIIISSTKSSKPFDAQLRALGFPPYKQRLQNAYQQAAEFSRPVQCQAISASAR